MCRKVRNLFKLISLFTFLGLPIGTAADDLAEALSGAMRPVDSTKTKVWVSIDGCELREHIVNIGYCARVERGEGDRHIEKLIRLNEVEEIEVVNHRSKLMVQFNLDFGRPGSFWLMKDQLINGSEGAVERYVEETDRALLISNILSRVNYSMCEGLPPSSQKKSSLVLFFDAEPEHFGELLKLTRQCRNGAAFKVTDSR